MGDTTIEWATKVWNPVVGCSPVSPGCEHCYAARVAAGRLRHHPAYRGLAVAEPGRAARFTGAITVRTDRFDQPLRWRRPERVFVNSMSDLAHPGVDRAVLVELWVVMALAERHTFMVLTKLPQRLARVITPEFAGEVTDIVSARGGRRVVWPPSNVGVGVSIEQDRYSFRAGWLRGLDVAWRFVSAEPLLGSLASLDLAGIDWVICGGESGPGARPMHPLWPRELRDRCVGSDVAFFFKQWGTWGELPPGWPAPGSGSNRSRAHAVAYDGRHWPMQELAIRELEPRGSGWDRHFEYVHETGRQLARERGELHLHVMHRVGKNEAGRDLDGRRWDELPARPTTTSSPSPVSRDRIAGYATHVSPGRRLRLVADHGNAEGLPRW